MLKYKKHIEPTKELITCPDFEFKRIWIQIFLRGGIPFVERQLIKAAEGYFKVNNFEAKIVTVDAITLSVAYKRTNGKIHSISLFPGNIINIDKWLRTEATYLMCLAEQRLKPGVIFLRRKHTDDPVPSVQKPSSLKKKKVVRSKKHDDKRRHHKSHPRRRAPRRA